MAPDAPPLRRVTASLAGDSNHNCWVIAMTQGPFIPSQLERMLNSPSPICTRPRLACIDHPLATDTSTATETSRVVGAETSAVVAVVRTSAMAGVGMLSFPPGFPPTPSAPAPLRQHCKYSTLVLQLCRFVLMVAALMAILGPLFSVYFAECAPTRFDFSTNHSTRSFFLDFSTDCAFVGSKQLHIWIVH